MGRHRLSPEAEADLDEIWLHVVHKTGKIEIAITSLTTSRSGFGY